MTILLDSQRVNRERLQPGDRIVIPTVVEGPAVSAAAMRPSSVSKLWLAQRSGTTYYPGRHGGDTIAAAEHFLVAHKKANSTGMYTRIKCNNISIL